MKRNNPRDVLRPLDQAALQQLLSDVQGPCISIYVPTARKGADTRANPIRWKTCARQAERDLRSKYPDVAEQLMPELHDLVDDHDFWQHQLDGLALFRSPRHHVIFRLTRTIPERVVVAGSFHLKPLVRIMQTTGRYNLLAVSQKNVTLYEGDRDHLDPVPLHPDVPRTLVEALGDEVQGYLNVNSHGGMGYNGMFHGHHDNRDDRDIDLERFFRVVDKAIYEHHGRHSNLPLYLAADVDYHDRYRKVSRNPRLQERGVRINPDAAEVNGERLRKEVEQIILEDYHARTRDLIEQYGSARPRRQGSDDLRDVARAAAMGRVGVLLLDADRQSGGRIDPETGDVHLQDQHHPDVDDVYDDLAELVLRNGGDVQVIPSEVHPTETGVAAVYRY